MQKYNHQEVEAAWQRLWEDEQTFTVKGVTAEPHAYILDMFPYPSAQGLHVGHPEGYTASDIYCRYLRMTGENVLHPMGWDAFGLPAENYAIKTSRHPRVTTEENIQNIKRQIKSLGFSYDWSREINTADPNYYRWTQWLFLQLHAKGLAYRQEAPVNWCPSCQTVLANEQVVAGKCERCQSVVEQRKMKQWFFKTTAYAEKLLDDLDDLDWPQSILDMQRHWIGKSVGAQVKFLLKEIPGLNNKVSYLEVFTTRLDTIFGATFIVISPELAKEWVSLGWEASAEVNKYVAKSLQGRELERLERAAKDKTGVDTGIKAINPANGQVIPVWVADYVLGSYGTGGIMAVPAHDERDHQFAKKFNLPITRVVEPKFIATEGDSAVKPKEKYIKREAICAVVYNPKNSSYLCVSWKDFYMHGFITGGVDEGEDIVAAAKREVLEETGYKNIRLVKDPGFALHSLFYHRLKKENRWARFNYLFFELENEEQQPISDKEINTHEIVWKKKEELRDFFSVVEGEFTMHFLTDPDYIHSGLGVLHNSGSFDGLDSAEAIEKIASKLSAKITTQYRLRDWLISRQRYWGAPIPMIYCEHCGEVPVPEKDLPVLLPEDVDFKPMGESPLERSISFHKVVCPKCGASARRESDTMDTFVDSAWYFLRYCDPDNNKEAFDKKKVEEWCPVNFYVGGAEHAVLHLLYARFFTKVLKDLGKLKFSEPFLKLRNQGLILGEDGQKMSKSRGNVINPDDIIKQYGADTLRLYEMFMGPFEDTKPWNTASIIGIRRFLEKVWYLALSPKASEQIKLSNSDASTLAFWVAKTTKKVTEDILSFRFNTAIAALMEFTNYLSVAALPVADQVKVLGVLLRLIYPFAPHLAAELWQQTGRPNKIWEQSWPAYDPKALQQTEVKVVVQINGKLRAQVVIAVTDEENEVIDAAKNNEIITKHLEGKNIIKTVYVPNKLINFVVQ